MIPPLPDEGLVVESEEDWKYSAAVHHKAGGNTLPEKQLALPPPLSSLPPLPFPSASF